MGNRSYYVYIMSNYSKTLYIGVTNNLERRVFEHKRKLVEGFTKKYNITKLVYYEIFDEIMEAIAREKRLKRWHRQWKINLVESINKDWEVLAEEWYNELDIEDYEETLKTLKQVQGDKRCLL